MVTSSALTFWTFLDSASVSTLATDSLNAVTLALLLSWEAAMPVSRTSVLNDTKSVVANVGKGEGSCVGSDVGWAVGMDVG